MKSLAIILSFAMATTLAINTQAQSSPKTRSATNNSTDNPINNLPGDSVYQVTSSWQLENGQQITLSQFAGKTQLVAFVYSHCTSICPVIVEDLKKIEKALDKNTRQRTNFLLITLDPQSDTPTARQAFMQQHKLDNKHWHFIASNDADTQELALLLNIRYRREGDEIVHSNMVTVLSGNGRIVFQGVAAKDMAQLVRIISQRP